VGHQSKRGIESSRILDHDAAGNAEEDEVRIAFALGLAVSVIAWGGEFRRTLHAFPGETPKIDGVVTLGEWEDATHFYGVEGWAAQFSPTKDPKDLSLQGWVKHDGKRLYFAFRVTDDVLYGIDIPRWLPQVNPKAHDLTQEGYPWFGDEMELLINASNKWLGNENAAGDGASWQMVCNLTKSRKDGVLAAGPAPAEVRSCLLEGEPRKDIKAWNTYRRWIDTGAQEGVARVNPGAGGYTVEWAVNFNPCLEVSPGVFYSTSMGSKPMGLNIALGDLDEQEKGAGNFANFHHEDWWAGEKNTRTQLRQWGTIWIMSEKRSAPTKPSPK
jgi:SSS family solute:Na+ symporter